MKTLTLTHAKNLINWFATEGQSNWGVWGNYPSLPVSARYHSFDTCPVRVLFNETVEFHGHEFNCVANGRSIPGNNIVNISFVTLKSALMESGVEFVDGSYMTSDKANELTNDKLINQQRIVSEFTDKYTYDWCVAEVVNNINLLTDMVSVAKAFGTPIAPFIQGYELKIDNYCEKSSVTILVDLELVSTNARNTVGRYKVVSDFDKAPIVELFAKEKFASYSNMRSIHEADLVKMLA